MKPISFRARRPASQAPTVHHRAARFLRGRREAWRKVTWQDADTYRVEGDERVFYDPVEAIHAAEERRVRAFRTSDGLPLNYYLANEET